GRRSGARPAHAPRLAGRARGGPEPARVRPARVSDAQCRPLGVSLPDRRSGVELPVRSRDERRGRVRQLPPQEAELRRPNGADPDSPRRRVPARNRHGHVNERRLGAVLTRRFTRVAWTGLAGYALRSEEHTSELQSLAYLV